MHWLLARVRRLHPALPERARDRRALRPASRAAPTSPRELRLSRASRSGDVRAHVRLGVAAEARARSWREAAATARRVAAGARAARGGVRRRATSTTCRARTIRALRHAREQRVRPRASRSTTRARAGMPALESLCIAKAQRVVRRRSRRAGRVGTLGRRFPVAGADGSRADAARARAGGLRRLARRLPARIRCRRAADAVHAGRRRAIAATATSCISTASTCRAHGACAASPALLDDADPRAARGAHAAAAHLAAGFDGLASADYVGAHWLATFAALALTGSDREPAAKLHRMMNDPGSQHRRRHRARRRSSCCCVVALVRALAAIARERDRRRARGRRTARAARSARAGRAPSTSATCARTSPIARAEQGDAAAALRNEVGARARAIPGRHAAARSSTPTPRSASSCTHSASASRELTQTVEQKLDGLRNDNAQKLEQMRATVDEKLQTTLEQRLGESFKRCRDRLEQVHAAWARCRRSRSASAT